MKLSDLVQTTRQNKPPRIVLHGIQKIGKSTWAAGAPNPIFLQLEDGLGQIQGVKSFPVPSTLSEFFSYMDLLINEDNEYQSVVIDTVDWLEKLIWKTVCEDNKVASIENIGYGKGYAFAMTHWEKFFSGLEVLRGKEKAIVVLAHNEIRTFNPPDGDPWDRYQIKLHKTAAAKLEEWADVILFAGYNVIVKAKSKQAINAETERLIYTSSRPAWKAGSRYVLPDTLPLSFPALLEAIKNQPIK